MATHKHTTQLSCVHFVLENPPAGLAPMLLANSLLTGYGPQQARAALEHTTIGELRCRWGEDDLACELHPETGCCVHQQEWPGGLLVMVLVAMPVPAGYHIA